MDAPFGAGSLSLAKEAELAGFQPPSFAMAAFAATCSAAPQSLRFAGDPISLKSSGGQSPPSGKKFPGLRP